MDNFTVNKKITIAYTISNEEEKAIETTREILDELVTKLDENAEYEVYFNDFLYDREEINSALNLLINMCEYNHYDNILKYGGEE